MSKKFTRLMAILLSLNLTFSTGTFAAFAAEAEDGSTDTGYSESGDPAASAPKAENGGTESTPDTSSPAPTEGTGENAEPSAPSEYICIADRGGTVRTGTVRTGGESACG